MWLQRRHLHTTFGKVKDLRAGHQLRRRSGHEWVLSVVDFLDAVVPLMVNILAVLFQPRSCDVALARGAQRLHCSVVQLVGVG